MARAVVLVVASQQAAPQYEQEAEARVRRMLTSFKSRRLVVERIKSPSTTEGTDSALLAKLQALLTAAKPAACDGGTVEGGLKKEEAQAYNCQSSAISKGKSGLAYTQMEKAKDIAFITHDTFLAASVAELAAKADTDKQVHVVFNVTDDSFYGPKSKANFNRARNADRRKVSVYVMGARKYKSAATAPALYIETPAAVASGKDIVVLWDNDSGQQTVAPPKRGAWGVRGNFADLAQKHFNV